MNSINDFVNTFSAHFKFLCIGLIVLIFTNCARKPEHPNIVIIYADDMGYGDLACQNPASQIPTPNLDAMAAEGMRFSDAHSSSGICSPSRFALLTGTYHWRRQHNIVNAFGKPFFNDADSTLPALLQQNGYATACIGKWHLGWNWNFINTTPSGAEEWNGKTRHFYTPDDVDWGAVITGGPLDRGFDYYFGDGTINFPPYAWMENNRILGHPHAIMDAKNVGFKVKEGQWEFRPGPKVSDWNPYEVLPTITQKAVEWITTQEKSSPFFLYLALPSPHAPIIPNDTFDGTSGAGPYGDFMVQTDWVVGQVLQTLKARGLEEDTLVIFSSDNGPEKYAFDRAEKYGHYSMGNFRGVKRDVWEGGHHVPLIVKWPGRVEGGIVSDETISQVDIMATLASLTNISLPSNAAPDSYDFSKVWKGEQYHSPIREATVHNTYANIWGLRKGNWLYINSSTGEHTKMPEAFKILRKYKDFDTAELLFHMKDDPEQRINLYDQYPEKAKKMKSLLQTYQEQDRSVTKEKN